MGLEILDLWDILSPHFELVDCGEQLDDFALLVDARDGFLLQGASQPVPVLVGALQRPLKIHDLLLSDCEIVAQNLDFHVDVVLFFGGFFWRDLRVLRFDAISGGFEPLLLVFDGSGSHGGEVSILLQWLELRGFAEYDRRGGGGSVRGDDSGFIIHFVNSNY